MDNSDGHELPPPRPTPCVNCGKPRAEHTGAGLQCPVPGRRMFFTTAAEIEPE